MTYIPNITQLQLANSTSYADLLGLQFGLPRLLGENTNSYIKRLCATANMRRDAPYEGALNEITLQLGLEPASYISVELGTDIILTCSIAGVVIGAGNPSTEITIPLLRFDSDTMWDWRMLSDVVKDINGVVPATLLVDDGPALQLARQTNSLWSFSEPVHGQQVQLLHSGIQVESVLFNQTVPTYTLTSGGALNFAASPPSALTITYSYIVTPYNLVGSPVALVGFLDPEFASVAVTTNDIMAYQLREFLQAIMTIDRSYWAV